MKQARIKQLEALERNLLSDGYEVTVKITAKNTLLLSIKLREHNDKQIMKWGSVRRVGG